MKIVSWNINSIRARLDRLTSWLTTHTPDVICLQETKVIDSDFPVDTLAGLGYHSLMYGQPTYNGVAILSRQELTGVQRGVGLTGADGEEARLISAVAGDLHIINVYVPNGKEVGSDRYDYKLEWFGRLRDRLQALYTPSDRVVICGDFNVAPEDRDVARPEEWANSVLCHPAAREALQQVRSWGLIDTLRVVNDSSGIYSWWDYRMLGFPKNNGLRIDQIYATAPQATRVAESYVDREARKGDKPSDHAPVVTVFTD